MADATPPASSDQLEPAPEDGKPLTPLTDEEAADSIAELLGDDPPKADPAPKAKETASEAAPELEPEPDPLGDDDDEDVKTDDEPEEPDGSPDAGQYVSPKAKYKMADGSEITVGELARNNLFQRDYSQKTEALKRESETVKAKSQEVEQLSKTLSDERQYLIWFAEQFAPKPPQPPADPTDIVAEIEFQKQLRYYQTFAESYRQFKAGADEDTKRKAGETQKQANARAAREVQALLTKVKIDPSKDKAKADAFFNALSKGAKEHFGLNDNEIAAALRQDHRFGLILRKAIKAAQSEKAAPQVQKTLEAVPKIRMTPSARATPGQQEVRKREQLRERQRQSGSDEDAIARLSLIPDL